MLLVDNGIEDIELDSDASSNEAVNSKAENKKRHKRLLKDLDEITGTKRKRSKKSTRNQPASEVSEFNWSKDASTKLQLHEMIGSLNSNKKPVAMIKSKLRKMEMKTKVSKKPLTKPEAQKVERKAGYKDVKGDISKWDPIVQKNREADSLVFPLNRYKTPRVTTNSLVNFEPKNDLEREISAVLRGSEHLLERKGKELSESEEKALKEFDLQEAMERRKELQRSRALRSYYEQKCRRTKKIKSKKYHRILRKEEQKSLEKVDIEALAKDQPELFNSELEKAERMRAMERANLRHRNTSKWAKNLITKGRKTKEDQERIREQLRISRDLTDHKTICDEELSDEEKIDAEESGIQLLKENGENPWLMGGRVAENVKPKSKTRIKAIAAEETNDTSSEAPSSGDEWDGNQDVVCDVTNENQNREDHDVEKSAQKENNPQPSHVVNKKKTVEKRTKQSSKTSSRNVKSKNNTKEDKALRSLQNDDDAVVLAEESSDDDVIYDEEQRQQIQEAFANDDVIADFVREKCEIVEKSKPKAVDTTLPGWGDWAGAGMVVSAKKRRRFTKKPLKGKKRQDESLSHVVISEMRNTKLAQIQVSGVPFPYTSKVEYERSIRQPIGDLWNTASVHKKLIEPRISTVHGLIIEPIKASRKMKQKFKEKT